MIKCSLPSWYGFVLIFKLESRVCLNRMLGWLGKSLFHVLGRFQNGAAWMTPCLNETAVGGDAWFTAQAGE